MTTVDSVLVIGGDFTSVAGQPRARLAAFDLRDGSLLPWNPGADRIVRVLVTKGRRVYAAGDFTLFGGAARNWLASFDWPSETPTLWNPALPSVRTIAFWDSLVILGGLRDTYGPHVPNYGLAAADTNLGTLTAWAPVVEWCVNALLVRDSTLYVGGEFSRILGQQRQNLAAFDMRTGALTNFAVPAADSIYSLAMRGDLLLVVGWLRYLGSQTRYGLGFLDPVTEATTPWRIRAAGETRLAWVSDGDLGYVGGGWITDNLNQSGLLRVLEPDVQPPTVAAEPTGGPIVRWIGDASPIRWEASDSIGVRSVDLRVSRLGPEGPWETIALGVRNTGAYPWQVTGPSIGSGAVIRVDARDWAGNIGTSVSSAFAIADSASVAAVEGPGTRTGSHDFVLAPVPAGNAARLRFTLSGAGELRVTLMDIQGRRVCEPAERHFDPGTHSWMLDTHHLRTGLYFVRMEASGWCVTKRLAIVR